MELEGKVCLVTGGSSGIGKATCELLASLGAKVSICDLDSKNGEALAKELNDKYGSEIAIFNHCDTRDITTIRECFKVTKEKFGYVDVLFNNAGIWDDSPEGWSRQVDINFKGPVNGCVVAMEYMGTQNGGKGGTVISTASILGIMTTPVMPIYSATKAAVFSLTRNFGTPFHYELNKIRYMSICPHATGTNLFVGMENKFFTGGDKLIKLMEAITDKSVIQTPQSVANGVVHALKHGDNGSTWFVEMDKPPKLVTVSDLTSCLLREGSENLAPTVKLSV